jgi:lipoprotein-anchoring transpeptidase ErfK/SrfK
MRIPMGQIMIQAFTGHRGLPLRAVGALVFGATLLLLPALHASEASAQTLGYASTSPNGFSSDDLGLTPAEPAPADDVDSALPERLRRAVVSLDTSEAPGTVIIDTGNTALYYVLGHGRAIRYGVGVGRQGFTWSGVQKISRKAEWPDWYPPAEMIARQPYLPRFMAGGPGNPLGARALYLGSSEYRIHGTNNPATIGKFVSSGCIRLTNQDVEDLFSRVDIGTRVVVLPKHAPHLAARVIDARGAVRPAAAQSRPEFASASTRRQAMNLSASSLY